MITEIVTFTLPEGMTPEDAAANFEKTAPTWRGNPDLIRKNYLLDATSASEAACISGKKGLTLRSGTDQSSGKGQRDLRLGAEEPVLRHRHRRR